MYVKKIKILMMLALILLVPSCKKEVNVENKKNKKDTINAIEPIKEKIILTEKESNFLKSLIKDEIGKQKYKEMQVSESPYYVSFDNDGDPYTVSFSIVKAFDFDKDGIIDYVIDRSSEGMLGGNANTNQEYIYYILKEDSTTKEKHTVLGYAPFSYNIIDDAKFVGEKLKIDVKQNFRTYATNNVKSTSLSFIYKNNNLYEESYLSDCKLAKLKSKTIFIDSPEVEKRVRSIEWHNYTETIEEIYKKNDTIVTARLEGCDNLTLSLDTEYIVEKSKLNDKEFRKNNTLQFLKFLEKNTQFPNEIKILINYYNENDINDEYIKRIDGYKFRVLIQQNDKSVDKLRFLIQIMTIDNPYQMENWEITTRQKTAQ